MDEWRRKARENAARNKLIRATFKPGVKVALVCTVDVWPIGSIGVIHGKFPEWGRIDKVDVKFGQTVVRCYIGEIKVVVQ